MQCILSMPGRSVWTCTWPGCEHFLLLFCPTSMFNTNLVGFVSTIDSGLLKSYPPGQSGTLQHS